MAVFILSFEATGGFGYVMRIPGLDKIESVAIRTVEAGDYQTYARYRTGSGTVISESPQYMVYRETENIALVHEIHQSLLEKKGTLEEGNTSLDVDINLEYRMKNGSVFRRSYRLISEKELQNLVALNCSQEFLEQKYPFLEDGFTYGLKARTAVMEPFVKEGEVVAYESLGIAADEVAQALKKDILARPAGIRDGADRRLCGQNRHFESCRKRIFSYGFECEKGKIVRRRRCNTLEQKTGDFDIRM